MRVILIGSILLSIFACRFAEAAEATVLFSGEKKQNNLVSVLLEVSSISKSGDSFPFTRSSDGWMFVSATHKGKGAVNIIIDNAPMGGAVIVRGADGGTVIEAVGYVAKGEHQIRPECEGELGVDKLVLKAIPELIDCGLFDPAIKSYGHYDMDFLRKDILPNVTGLIVPHGIKLPQSVIDDWRRQGKKLIAQVGVSAEGKTGDDHFKYWTNFLDTASFADGIIIDEFIVNNPSRRPDTAISPERQARMEQERQRHQAYEEAFRQMRADDRYKDKTVYAYIGGSGKN